MYKATPDKSTVIDLDQNIQHGDGIENKSIMLKADVPLFVSIQDADFPATSVPELKPSDKEFLLVGYEPWYTRMSYVTVIAVEDDTKVEINIPDMDPPKWTATLKKLQTYTLRANKTVVTDFTGGRVVSNKPVTVYAGTQCSKITTDIRYCDGLIKVMPPIQELGKSHIVPPVPHRADDVDYVVRVIPSKGDTTVQFNETYKETVKKGSYAEVENLPASEPTVISCSAPCMVVQFNKGKEADWTSTDPFMSIIPPTDQYTDMFQFSTYNSLPRDFSADVNHTVIIVAKSDVISKMMLNKEKLSKWTWTEVEGKTEYKYTFMKVAEGDYTITVDEAKDKKAFAAWVYGTTEPGRNSYIVVSRYKGMYSIKQGNSSSLSPTT